MAHTNASSELPLVTEHSRMGDSSHVRIAHGRLGTVAAALLALATSQGSSAAPGPNTPHPLHRGTYDTPVLCHGELVEPLRQAQGDTLSPSVDAAVENFRRDGNRFTCTFGATTVEGVIAEDGAIPEIRFDGHTVILSQPVSVQTLERFLRHATATSALLNARGVAPRNGTMEALGGARFLFTTDTEGRAQPHMATMRDVFTMDPAEEKERRAAETQWKDVLRHCTELSQKQNDAINARIEVHNGRMRTVYDDLSRRAEYDNWYYWQQRRNEFAQGWNAIATQWKIAGTDGRGNLLSRFHVHLDSWEQWIAIKPDMEAEGTFRSRYDATVRELAEHRVREQALRTRAHTRTLRGTTEGGTVVEKSSPLSAKNFTREERRSGALVAYEEYADDVRIVRLEYDSAGKAVRQMQWQYFPGAQVRRAKEYERKEGKLALQRQTDYWKSGNARAILDNRSDAFAYFSERGGLLYEDVARSNRAKRQRGIVDKDGNRFGLYGDEKTKNPSLTPSQYLDMLAQKLDTEEKIAVFFEQFLWYANDHWDEWQTAEETVQRMEENGQSGARYMRGDCDDYAFLARAILRRQGKNAHVLGIPSHAICVWVETDAEGEYHARSLGTFGLDHNGNRYGPDYPRDRAKAGGFKRLIDALNALMKKYRYPGLGVAEGQDYTLDPQNITILPNPPAGSYKSVTAEYFLEKVS